MTLSIAPVEPFDPDLPRFPTIIHALIARADENPDAVAAWCETGEIRRGAYRDAIAALAGRLLEAGARGGRVALLMRNGIECNVAGLAAMAAGAQVAPMNYNYPPKALLPLLKDVDAAVLIVDRHAAGDAHELAEAAEIGTVIELGLQALSVEALAAEGGPMPAPLPSPEDRSVMFFTGGTTGFPKAASHTHANDMAFCLTSASRWHIGFDDARLLNVAPNFHVWGFFHLTFVPVYRGAPIDIVVDYKPDVILKRFEEKRITAFCGGPAAMFVGLRAHENFTKTDFSHLEYCIAGGSSCPLDLLRGWEEVTGSPIIEGCGMSEGAPTASNPSHGVRKPGSVGPPNAQVEMKLVDIETGTKTVPLGERGEICVRGPNFIDAYHNRPEETAEAIRDGWLHTGDIGYFDEDFYLFMVDRKKEMLLVGGYNVYPREIEEVLTDHPAIMEAAVIGAPDSFRGETVKACVALNPGATASEEDIVAHCQEHLVKYKVPTIVAFFDQLPKTGPGKIDKLTLKGAR